MIAWLFIGLALGTGIVFGAVMLAGVRKRPTDPRLRAIWRHTGGPFQ